MSGRPAGRRLGLGLGLGLLALGVVSEWILPGAPGYGPLQLLLIGAGLALVPLAVPSGAWERGYGALVSMVFCSYLVFLVFEFALDVRAGQPRNGMASLRGLVQPAPWGGYELTPGWRGVYDDGWAKSAVDINTHGDRDDEPEQQPAGAHVHAVLLGDSQAFGVGLAREQDIESQIEKLSAGAVAAYNLGVLGYGPGDSLEHYRGRPELRASHVFFLLYGNDVRLENCRTAYSVAYAGYIVPRERADGLQLSPRDLEQAVTSVRKLGYRSWTDRIKSTVLLERLRMRFAALLDSELVLRTERPDGYSEECSLEAARNADAMRGLAAERGQRFAVVIVPSPGEAALQRYSQPVQTCIDELKRRSIPIVDLRELLSPRDYLEGDEHLGPSGAAKVAAAIVRSAGS